VIFKSFFLSPVTALAVAANPEKSQPLIKPVIVTVYIPEVP